MRGILIKTVDEGDTTNLINCWEIKQEILNKHDLLKQSWNFFYKVYKNNKVYLLKKSKNNVLGYAIIDEKNNGYYLSLLAIRLNKQGNGLSKKLMNYIISEIQDNIYCHVRINNKKAVNLYKSLGFDIIQELESFYNDGGNAYLMSRYESSKYK